MSNTNTPIHIGLVGTGGYAREVMPLLVSQHKDSDNAKIYYIDFNELPPIDGIPVISEENFLNLSGRKFFNIAVADSKLREKIALKYEGKGCIALNIWADNSIQIGNNELDAGHIVSPFSCITADAKIGRYFHCNIYSYVAHDCVIGDFVTFAPNVRCNGNVVIEDHAYIGTGAIIKQGLPGKPLVIGKGAVVGMGAIVTKDVAPGQTVIGNPARPMNKVAS